MKSMRNLLIAALFATVTLLQGCGDSNDAPADYNVELAYPAGITTATQGKTTFTLKLTDQDNNPVNGQTVELFPLMHMASY